MKLFNRQTLKCNENVSLIILRNSNLLVLYVCNVCIFQVQWLISMLDAACFLKPLNAHNKTGEEEMQYLHCGTYKPQLRDSNAMEKNALKSLYKTSFANTSIKVFHYAKKHINGKDVLYRDSYLESNNQRTVASVVSCALAERVFVGKVSFFFSHQLDGRLNELAFIDWIGQAEICIDSNCYIVRPAVVNIPQAMWIANLSSPLVHAWEDGSLWLPHV